MRAYFDEVIRMHPNTKSRLSRTATIVLQVTFRSALVKIQNGRTDEMNSCERIAVTNLEVNDMNQSGTIAFEHDNAVERALKRQKN